MKRYTINKLIEWKNNPNKKPLIIRGANIVLMNNQWKMI